RIPPPKDLDRVTEADRAATDDGDADAAAAVQLGEQSWAPVQAADVATGRADPLPAQDRLADPELQADQIVEVQPLRDDVAPQRVQHEPERVQQLPLDERAWRRGPARA